MPNIGSPYIFLIGVSVIVVLSYFYNLISKRTNIPTVLMLITTGIILNQVMNYFEMGEINMMPILELLGIVGLIMIVLEAALDLKLTKDKAPIIIKSMSVALLELLATTAVLTYIVQFFTGASIQQSIFYAMPMSILSSAIVIPSVGSLDEHKKEFLIYNSTFSDIFGIMFFYFYAGAVDAESSSAMLANFGTNTLITILLSFVLSYALVWVFQKIESEVKLFLLIAVLVLLYALGKMLHLSSLLIILTFGLILNNRKVFFQGRLSRWIKPVAMRRVLVDFRLITIETAFVVRTFFFVVFGMTIVLSSLVSVKVFLVSVIILAAAYLIRFIFLFFIERKAAKTELWIAPRGLITILLYFAIPSEYQIEAFESGILLYVILGTSIIMTWSLISSKKTDIYDELYDDEIAKQEQEAIDQYKKDQSL